MFDTVHNNFVKLGGDFAGPLRTRDLFNNESTFWISPAGEFFQYDDLATWRWVEKREGFFGFNAAIAKESTGKNIKLKPMRFSDCIAVFTARWDGSLDSTPEAWLHICDGKIDRFRITTRGGDCR